MGILTRERRWRSPARRRTDEKRKSQGRFLFLHLVVVAIFALLSFQLFRMQIIHGQEYEVRAQHNRLRVVRVPTQRGLIYDRDGVQLVENVPSFTASLVPADLPEEDRDAVYRILEEVLEVRREEISRQVALREASGDPFTPIKLATDIGREDAFTLQELRAALPGVQVSVDTVRRYDTGPLMSHTLGYVGNISPEQYQELRDQGYGINDRIGQTGVELTYEQYLHGRPGSKEVEIDSAGNEIQVLSEDPPTPGSDVVLSLDLDLQQYVEQTLREAMVDTDSGSAIVMDVRTGEILAMVSLPAYDNNVFSGTGHDEEIQRLLTDEAKPLLNHAIGENYAPGSTFKVVTGAAALQEGVATRYTRIFTGPLVVRNQFNPEIIDATFRDWNGVGFGILDFLGAYAQSSNVYFHCLAGGCEDDKGRNVDGLGVNRLAQYSRSFGFGAPTGIDLPGEASGLVPDPEWKQQTFIREDGTPDPWVLADTYFFGIGQGFLTVTPIQMVRLAATIANGGDVLEPTVVHEVRGPDGQVIATPGGKVVRRVDVSPENIQILQEALRYSVTHGLAARAEVPEVGVAGKTGTAEFGERQEVDGRAEYRTHGWFMGYAPYDDPEIAVVIFLHEGSSGRQAAPAAQKIIRYYFSQHPVGADLRQEKGR